MIGVSGTCVHGPTGFRSCAAYGKRSSGPCPTSFATIGAPMKHAETMNTSTPALTSATLSRRRRRQAIVHAPAGRPWIGAATPSTVAIYSLRPLGVIHPELVAQGVADLADGAVGAQRVPHRRQQVALAARRLPDALDRGRGLLGVALR